MLLRGKSTISTWPFSIVFCMFTGNPLFSPDQVPPTGEPSLLGPRSGMELCGKRHSEKIQGLFNPPLINHGLVGDLDIYWWFGTFLSLHILGIIIPTD